MFYLALVREVSLLGTDINTERGKTSAQGVSQVHYSALVISCWSAIVMSSSCAGNTRSTY